jgi:hypothetical protein
VQLLFHTGDKMASSEDDRFINQTNLEEMSFPVPFTFTATNVKTLLGDLKRILKPTVTTIGL